MSESLKPGRVARAGDLALVINDAGRKDPQNVAGKIVRVRSDPMEPNPGQTVNIVEIKCEDWLVRTSCLIPITPDEDTRKLFEAEKLRDSWQESEGRELHKLIQRHIREGKL